MNVELERYQAVLKAFIAAKTASKVIMEMAEGTPDAKKLLDAAELLDYSLSVIDGQLGNFDPDPQPAGHDKTASSLKLRADAVRQYKMDSRPSTKHLAL